MTFTTVPRVGANEKSDIVVTVVVREGAGKFGVYVNGMSSSEVANTPINVVYKVRSVYPPKICSLYSTPVGIPSIGFHPERTRHE